MKDRRHGNRINRMRYAELIPVFILVFAVVIIIGIEILFQ